MAALSRLLLIAFFLVSAGAKLLSEHRPEYALGPVAYYSVGVLELALAGVLSVRGSALGGWLAVLFCSAGVVLNFVWQDRPCGCMGHLGDMTVRTRIVVLAVVGTLACALVYAHLRGPVDPARTDQGT